MGTKILHFIARYHLLWVAFYVILLGSTAVFAKQLYVEYDTDQIPSGYVELTVSKTQYQLGEPVEFTVINHFPTTIYVTNHCPKEPLHVFRWENNEWVEMHDEAESPDSECYKQERNIAIAPESSRAYNFNDWPNLFKEPGVYRIAMTVDHYGDIPFQDFVILKPREVVEVKQKPVAVPRPQITPVQQPLVVPVPEPEIEEEFEEEEYEYEDEYEDEDEHEREEEDEDDD